MIKFFVALQTLFLLVFLFISHTVSASPTSSINLPNVPSWQDKEHAAPQTVPAGFVSLGGVASAPTGQSLAGDNCAVRLDRVYDDYRDVEETDMFRWAFRFEPKGLELHLDIDFVCQTESGDLGLLAQVTESWPCQESTPGAVRLHAQNYFLVFIGTGGLDCEGNSVQQLTTNALSHLNIQLDDAVEVATVFAAAEVTYQSFASENDCTDQQTLFLNDNVRYGVSIGDNEVSAKFDHFPSALTSVSASYPLPVGTVSQFEMLDIRSEVMFDTDGKRQFFHFFEGALWDAPQEIPASQIFTMDITLEEAHIGYDPSRPDRSYCGSLGVMIADPVSYIWGD